MLTARNLLPNKTHGEFLVRNRTTSDFLDFKKLKNMIQYLLFCSRNNFHSSEISWPAFCNPFRYVYNSKHQTYLSFSHKHKNTKIQNNLHYFSRNCSDWKTIETFLFLNFNFVVDKK